MGSLSVSPSVSPSLSLPVSLSVSLSLLRLWSEELLQKVWTSGASHGISKAFTEHISSLDRGHLKSWRLLWEDGSGGVHNIMIEPKGPDAKSRHLLCMGGTIISSLSISGTSGVGSLQSFRMVIRSQERAALQGFGKWENF